MREREREREQQRGRERERARKSVKDLTSAGKRSEKSGNSSLLEGLVEVKNYEHL